MPAPINWLRGVSCPYLVFDMGPTEWQNDRKKKEETIISIIRGEYKREPHRLMSIINEADRVEVMELIQNLSTFKGLNATWVEQTFFDIPYYALIGGNLLSDVVVGGDLWLCLILPTTHLGRWSKDLDHDWIDAYGDQIEEDWSEENDDDDDDDEGFEGLGSLFG